MNNEKKAEYQKRADLEREKYISRKESITTSNQLTDTAKQEKLLALKVRHNDTLQKLREDFRAGKVSRKAELEKKLFSLVYKPTDDRTAMQLSFRDALTRSQTAASADAADKDSNQLEKLLAGAEQADDTLLKTAIATAAREYRFDDFVMAAIGEEKAALYQQLVDIEDDLENPRSSAMFEESSIFTPVEYVSSFERLQDIEPAEPEPIISSGLRLSNTMRR